MNMPLSRIVDLSSVTRTVVAVAGICLFPITAAAQQLDRMTSMSVFQDPSGQTNATCSVELGQLARDEMYKLKLQVYFNDEDNSAGMGTMRPIAISQFYVGGTQHTFLDEDPGVYSVSAKFIKKGTLRAEIVAYYGGEITPDDSMYCYFDVWDPQNNILHFVNTRQDMLTPQAGK